MADEHDDEELEQIRRAAFELRQSDPSRAVKELRRIARGKGDAAALAHGALGEILLEDFEDLDGAIHHFRKLLELAPGMAAGELGLARALARQGEVDGARTAYARALEGLEKAAREAMGAAEPPPGLEEAVLTMLEIAVEEREMLAELRGGRSTLEVPPDVLAWAEEQRLLDLRDEEDPEENDLGDWLRFAVLRGVLEALEGRVDQGLATVDRLAHLVPLPSALVHRVRSVVREAAGDARGAADEALAAMDGEVLADTDEVLRISRLLDRSGRSTEARMLIERALSEARGRIDRGEAFEDEQAEVAALEAERDRLPGAPVVGLGLRRRED